MTDFTDREKQAALEVGRTAFQPGVAAFLAVVLLAVIVTVPLVDAVRSPEVATGALQLAPAAFEVEQALRSQSVADGVLALNRSLHRNMEQWEANLEQTSFLRDMLLAPLNRIVSERMGARNADVCRGREDWLFYGPAIDHLTGRPFNAYHPEGSGPAPVLAAFSEYLAARNVRLVVVPVPVKASIYPERVSRAYEGSVPLFHPAQTALVAALEERGVHVCDLGPALWAAKERGPVYLERDSHWTPHGQQAAAAFLARTVQDNQWLQHTSPVAYRAGPAESVRNRGDLVRLLYPARSDYGAPETVEVRPVVGPDGAAWEPERDSEVLLLGDSFANIYGLASMGWGVGAGFAAVLSRELQAPVDAITQNGDGAFATRLALQQERAQGRDRLEGKSVVVMVFSSRELSFGDWKPTLESGSR